MARGGDSSGLIILAVGAAAAYYAYTQNWLCSIFGIGASCPAAASAAVAAPAPVVTVPAASGAALTPAVPPPPPITDLPAPSSTTSLPAILTAYLVANGYQPSQSFSGFQWDYLANRALGAQYVNLSLLPTLVGANQYTMQQYLAAYPASSSGVAGLGRTVVYLPRRGVKLVLPGNYQPKRRFA
jgi:hypothetical protein